MDKNTKQKLKQIWCEQSVIGLFGLAALWFFVAKIPTVYEQMQAQAQIDQAQAQIDQARAQIDQAQARLDQAQARLDQVQAQLKQAQIDQAQARIDQAQAQSDLTQAGCNQAQAQLKQVHAQFKQAWAQAEVSGRTPLQYQFMLLGISALSFILMLLLLLRRNQISLPLTGQLIIFLPEECIVELEALHQQIKSEEDSIWVIRMIMLWTVLELLWALHIQINVENLWLPKGKGHNKIDD